MKTIVAFAIALLFASSAMAQTATQLRQNIEAAGCTVTPLTSGKVTDGELAPGDGISSANGAFDRQAAAVSRSTTPTQP